jgi:hypothetical protein
MSSTEMRSDSAIGISRAGSVDIEVEIAERFYGDLAWGFDIDRAAEDDYRVIQCAPAPNACSSRLRHRCRRSRHQQHSTLRACRTHAAVQIALRRRPCGAIAVQHGWG